MTEFNREAFIASVHARFESMELRHLNTYIRGKRCGDCDLWMKSSMCPQEKPGTGKRSGYSVGPSCEGLTCGDFVPNFDYDIALQVQTMRKLES